MRSSLRRRQPVDPTAVGFGERCGGASATPRRADPVLQQARASAVAVRAGRP